MLKNKFYPEINDINGTFLRKDFAKLKLLFDVHLYPNQETLNLAATNGRTDLLVFAVEYKLYPEPSYHQYYVDNYVSSNKNKSYMHWFSDESSEDYPIDWSDSEYDHVF